MYHSRCSRHNIKPGAPWELSGSRIQHRYYCAWGLQLGSGSIPSPGTSACLKCSQKGKKNHKSCEQKENTT